MNRKQRRAAQSQGAQAGTDPVALAHAQFQQALTLQDTGRLEPAVRAYRQGLKLEPGDWAAWNNLGNALGGLGRLEEAAEALGRAAQLMPGAAYVQANLGNLLRRLGRADAAAAALGRAAELEPREAARHADLGLALREAGRDADAVASLERAVALQPTSPDLLNILGALLHDQMRLTEAEACYRRAIALRPSLPEAHNNLGNTLADLGRPDEAIAAYRSALALRPDYLDAHSNLQMSLHASARVSEAEILAHARAFAAQVEPRGTRSFRNVREPERRLRIGYVSADFRTHPIGFFLEGVLKAHDPDRVEAICYSNLAYADDVTARLKAAAKGWRSIAGVPDDKARATIEADRIDILVDLSGHTSGNRLPLFGLRAAPVQASWLGYFGTTGLSAMDYIVTDRVIAPEGEEDRFSEIVMRLPGCYLCYSPPAAAPAPGPYPALANGFVTFGCFNNLAKAGPETLAAWAQILQRVQGSRLLLKARPLADERVRAALAARFQALGVDAARLTLEGHFAPAEALAAYNRVDVALDPFPFGGCTTTAETLWMGVPVVTQAGTRWAGRMSRSILATVDQEDWVAMDSAEYVDLACRLAADLPAVRADLRGRLQASRFCDAPGFTRGLESAYREMWTAWCCDGGRARLTQP